MREAIAVAALMAAAAAFGRPSRRAATDRLRRVEYLEKDEFPLFCEDEYEPLGGPPDGGSLFPRSKKRNRRDGSQGHVTFRRHATAGPVVVKEISAHFALARNEVNVMRTLNEAHVPNVVQMVGAYMNEEQTTLYVVTRFIGWRTLADVLKKARPRDLDDGKARANVRRLLETLVQLKRLGIVHGDIKPENIVLDEAADDAYVLIDFGLAGFGTAHGGTKGFMSPEAVAAGQRDYAADVWSVGAVMYCVLERRPGLPLKVKPSLASAIYHAWTMRDADDAEFERVVSEVDIVYDRIAGNALDLNRRMLAEKDRISAEEALQHPWFLDAEPLIAAARRTKSRVRTFRSLVRPKSVTSTAAKRQQWSKQVSRRA